MGCLICLSEYSIAFLQTDTMSPTSTTSSTSLQSGKFPHTRAQLAAVARQFKLDDSESDQDDNRLPQSFVNQIVSLLVDEKEDELKTLLQTTFAMDEDSVRRVFFVQTTSYAIFTGRTQCLGIDAQASRRCCRRTLPLPNSDAPTHLTTVLSCIHPFFSSLSSAPRHSFFGSSIPSCTCIS
jgi:hypothetical protein